MTAQEKDIYENDELDREMFCKSITAFIEQNGKQDKGLTIALNGEYGSGKSMALGFLKNELEAREGMTVVYYDCWKNSIFNEPLLPIIKAILKEVKTTKSKVKDAAKNVIGWLGMFGKNAIGSAIGVEIPEGKKGLFDGIDEYEKLIAAFKKELASTIKENVNLVILFDEIDRCLPGYAIQILEKINHLFDIPGLTCLVAVDNRQLEKTIETIFGKNMNVRGYITRFIDFEIDLPKKPDLEQGLITKGIHDNYKHYILPVVNCFDMGLREKIKLFNSFRIFAALYNDRNKNTMTQFHGRQPMTEAVAMMFFIVSCVKSKNNNLYYQLFKQELNSRDIYNQGPKIKISETKVHRLFSYMTEVGFDKSMFDKSRIDWAKCIFASAFLDHYNVKHEDLFTYLNCTEEQFSSYARSEFDIYPKFRSSLANIIQFLEQLG